MRDVKITLSARGKLDTISFTVLWVEKPTIRWTGLLSANNAASMRYHNWTTSPQNYELKFQLFSNSLGGTRWGFGNEGAAKVHPTKFAYPNARLRLARDVENQYYAGPKGAVPDRPRRNFEGVANPTETSPDWARDDNPAPDDYLYEFDAPGLEPVVQPGGTIHRARSNYQLFASAYVQGIYIRCSEKTEYFCRRSLTQTMLPSGDTWVRFDDNEFSGDNLLGDGITPLSWDLSKT